MKEFTTEADYTDVFGTDHDFEESHCFTYVQAVPPEELLGELKASRVTTGTAVTGLSALREWTIELYRLKDQKDHTFEEVQPVGVVPVGDWTLMVEYNGLLGTEPEVMLPVTRGRTAVSHMANVSPVGPFYWYVDVCEPAVLPVWLEQELERTGHLSAAAVPAPRPVPLRAQQAVLAAGGAHTGSQGVLAAVLAPVEACGRVSEGAGFSDALNRAAYTLGGLVAAGRIGEEAARRALRESAAAARPGQERRAEGIISSGLSAGREHPLPSRGRRP
ncbi:DUF6461 domain-containing protein [Streptomyces coelicoflavus]|uniref:DUF6461 domain-containing protein n=1 Tax=Streptomyces coelicoflavus TaxID=285562 RepID=UPI003633FAC7